jgi:hypothetical protein
VPELSPVVVALLRRHVRSVEQLDVLLHLASSSDGCTIEQLDAVLKTRRHSVEMRLRELERDGIVMRRTAPGSTVYVHADAHTDRRRAVLELLALGPTWRPRIIEQIFAGGDSQARG